MDTLRVRDAKDVEEVVRAAIAGGATAIQLRDKTASTRRLMEIGEELRALTRPLAPDR